jgi:hypothetical protein
MYFMGCFTCKNKMKYSKGLALMRSGYHKRPVRLRLIFFLMTEENLKIRLNSTYRKVGRITHLTLVVERMHVRSSI